MPASQKVAWRIASVLVNQLRPKAALELLDKIEAAIKDVNGSESVRKTFASIRDYVEPACPKASRKRGG